MWNLGGTYMGDHYKIFSTSLCLKMLAGETPSRSHPLSPLWAEHLGQGWSEQQIRVLTGAGNLQVTF